MEELFRFSVLRAATRSNPKTTSIARTPPPSTIAAPPPEALAPKRPSISRVGGNTAALVARARSSSGGGTTYVTLQLGSLQDKLHDAVQSALGQNPASSNEALWASMVPIALEYLVRRLPPDMVLTQIDLTQNDPLWKSLGDFAENLESLVFSGTIKSNTTKPLSDLFEKAPKFANDDYLFELADLFLSLLIVRRGGPIQIENIIRTHNPPLWDIADKLLSDPTLREIADRVRALYLLKRQNPSASLIPQKAGSDDDFQQQLRAAFREAMNSTILLPSNIFSVLAKPLHGVGWEEFHVVKQHIRGYQLGEVAKIENVLKGESRNHATKHTLSNERDTFLQTEKTTETDNELTSTDRVNIKNEAENQVKEDTKVDAGVHASYESKPYGLKTDLTVSFQKSDSNTKKFAAETAKEVIQKAVTKVTEKVTQSQTTKIIETWEETEDHSFENKAQGSANISGIYQWVEKVYLAQTFNLGRHLVLDMMVPEPGASLLRLATISPESTDIPQPPVPLTAVILDEQGKPVYKEAAATGPVSPGAALLAGKATLFRGPEFTSGGPKPEPLRAPLKPSDLQLDPTSPNFYGNYVAQYQVTGVSAPPPSTVSIGKAFAQDAGNTDVSISEAVKLDDGYKAKTIAVEVSLAQREGGKPTISGQIGAEQFSLLAEHGLTEKADWIWSGHADNISGGGARGTIAFSLISYWAKRMTVNVQIDCERTEEKFAEWQIQTYERIVARWQKLQQDYQDKIAALQFQKQTVGPLGAADPEANRFTERIELKRVCIAVMDNDNATVRGIAPNIAIQDWPANPNPPNTKALNPAVDPFQPVLPEPILETAQQLGSRVRWFEQAFEWENMAYILYPYYWGRRQTWLQRLNLRNDDPIFLKFLQAGYARVVVPVRLGFEWAVLFYLNTGLPWLGGELPPVGDQSQNSLYLDIAEEIKANTGGGEAGEKEVAVGEPWNYKLPTTLIKLRQDDALPSWTRVGPNPKAESQAKFGPDPDFPSDPKPGPWTWADGPAKEIPYSTS